MKIKTTRKVIKFMAGQVEQVAPNLKLLSSS